MRTDGHGGMDVSKYMKTHFHEAFLEASAKSSDDDDVDDVEEKGNHTSVAKQTHRRRGESTSSVMSALTTALAGTTRSTIILDTGMPHRFKMHKQVCDISQYQ